MPRTESQPKTKTQKSHFLLFFTFLLIVIGSSLGLDFINWQQGKKSHIFSRLIKPPLQEKTETMEEFLLERLSALGVPVETSATFRGEKNVFHVPVSVQLDEYRSLAPVLEKELQRAEISLKVHKKSEETSESFLWEMEGWEGQRATLFFNCPKQTFEAPDNFLSSEQKNKVALIVDDMGYNLDVIKDLYKIGHPVTIAILPYSPLPRETAEIARQYNLEVILHLPFESINDVESNSLTEGIIHTGMSEIEILDTLEKDLLRVPHIRGVNNHMGSKATAKQEIMRPVLKRLKEKNLYFIDSLTSGRSIAYQLAREMAVPSAQRHVFLDAEPDEDFILRQWKKLLRVAQQKGVAVGICHPLDTTLRVLAANIHLLEEYGCEAVFASQVVR
ncbi:MAG: divergent polysaccharide deacetylase family protein [Candidatus Aminicenantes bacterium]|jgi:polysaccharide deacetylase 2 family uncharacterized protein YibQ